MRPFLRYFPALVELQRFACFRACDDGRASAGEKEHCGASERGALANRSRTALIRGSFFYQQRRYSGNPDPAFSTGTNPQIYVVVVQPDGKVLIGGYSTTLAPNGGAPVVRNHCPG